MIRPLTCLSLAAALGAGLYLYQEKHRAQLLDRDITRTVKQAEQAHDRIGLLKAEWALLNEPERLAGLATQHLQLQPLQPTQFVRLDDLRSRLPAVSAPPAAAPAAMEPPVAAVMPIQAPRTQLATAQVAAPAPPHPAPVLAAPVAVKPVAPASAPTVQVAAAQPAPRAAAAPRVQVAAAKPLEAEPPAKAPEPQHRPLFAPVMPAYAPTPVVIHAPTVQTASAVAAQPSNFVGSALGMGRTVLAAPVPVGSAALSGYATGR